MEIFKWGRNKKIKRNIINASIFTHNNCNLRNIVTIWTKKWRKYYAKKLWVKILS